ncbi:MAG: rhodanese family protein [Desulfovibrio sp.]|jgi:rhodanese-related sulfurtransferase|nr:rhodanese family protein [Desulfovibrio sp.]
MEEATRSVQRSTEKGDNMVQLVSPQEAAELLQTSQAILIDIREAEEYRHLHIKGARLHPLSVLDILPPDPNVEIPAIYYCHSGNRTSSALKKLERRGHARTLVIDGGINAWEKAGLPVEKGSRSLPVMRQVHIVAGGLILTSILLGHAVPEFFVITAVVGAGLLFSGLTGMCGMASLLARMPWNKN